MKELEKFQEEMTEQVAKWIFLCADKTPDELRETAGYIVTACWSAGFNEGTLVTKRKEIKRNGEHEVL